MLTTVATVIFNAAYYMCIAYFLGILYTHILLHIVTIITLLGRGILGIDTIPDSVYNYSITKHS